MRCLGTCREWSEGSTSQHWLEGFGSLALSRVRIGQVILDIAGAAVAGREEAS